MNILGNLLWLVLGGLVGSLLWAASAVLCMLTIIGIPFGLQCLKISLLTLMPFGTEVSVGQFGAMGLVGNIVWIIFFGWELFVYHLVCALLLAVTIIGLPFAAQHIKLARLALLPFGAVIA
jgi:uncharacterized membrane protein YccF (DUF307 family)